MKPWCRIGPYAVGVFAGYILYKTNCKLRMPKVNFVVDLQRYCVLKKISLTFK